ncbi:mannose-6-phosphate isomerase, class I [Bifidobacterium psychraerophilum]|uniref:mannose-6-phosphate isomerase, class I n=1 Tax=Bifidobacterium psychraerophilum TaxID=218140 RepID=UPI00310DD43E
MYRIQPVQKAYAWGSRDRLQAMFHLQRDAEAKTLAEMWFSGHRQSPSMLRMPDGSSIDVLQAVRQSPQEMLGESSSHLFGPVMPYLFKVISARIPLSLQVHPLDFQARAGFNRENAAGIAADAPERSFKDPLAKNEMVVALEPFTAAVGFAPLLSQIRLLESVRHPLAQHMAELLSAPRPRTPNAAFDPEHQAFDALMPLSAITWPESRRRIFRAFTLAITAAAQEGSGLEPALRDADRSADGNSHLALANALAAVEAFPDDPSILCLLMMNPVSLDEGESVFIPAGTPHAYIHGTAAEIMNNSDNVLRAGMTAKHKDIPNLLHSLNCQPDSPMDPSNTSFGILSMQNLVTYKPHINEFMLAYGHVDVGTSPWPIAGRLIQRYGELLLRLRPQPFLRQRKQLPDRGPRVLLCTDGAIHCSTKHDAMDLQQGQAVFIPSCDGQVDITAASPEPAGERTLDMDSPHPDATAAHGSYLLASTPF